MLRQCTCSMGFGSKTHLPGLHLPLRGYFFKPFFVQNRSCLVYFFKKGHHKKTNAS